VKAGPPSLRQIDDIITYHDAVTAKSADEYSRRPGEEALRKVVYAVSGLE